MPETLSRIYHGREIVSTRSERHTGTSDGWTHRIGERTFPTLSAAIQFVRRPEPSKKTEPGSPPVAPEATAIEQTQPSGKST